MILLTIGYALLLQTTSIGFRVATFAFVVVAGLTLYWCGDPQGRTRRSTSAAASTLCLVAVCLSLGIHYLFTQVLVVDLP